MTAMRIPVQCIVPPHMMRNLVEKGDARLRAWVMQTFVEAARIRGQREVMGLLPLAEGVGEKHRMIFDARHKKQKEEIDAKLADLRAKLSRHKKPAASP